MRLFRVLSVALLSVFAAMSAACATPVEDVFRDFGMFGTWAVDCSQPPSPANPRVTDVMESSGSVSENQDLGPDFAVNRYSVVAAERASREHMAIEVIFQPGTEHEQRQKLTLLIRKNTRRTMFNQPEGEAARVKDGVALARGIKTPVLKKCE